MKYKQTEWILILGMLLSLVPEVGLAAQRGTVMARNGMVASAHPLASLVGVNILQRGGNAMDAVIAMAGALNVLDPAMTGIGGDVFLLYYSAKEQGVVGLNASGRAPYAATVEAYRAKGYTTVPVTGPLSITVPGALDGWVRALERYGTLPLSELLQPAIRYAEEGFPVYPTLLGFYKQVGARVIPQFPDSVATYFINGRPPQLGEVLIQKNLARTLRIIAEVGKSNNIRSRDLFYKGAIGEKIVNYLKEQGGLLTLEDLMNHTSDWVEPITTHYRGFTIYEFPPNSQGVALLQQLNILEGFNLAAMESDSPEKIHLQVEATRLAVADLEGYVTDPKFVTIPLQGMLSKEYAEQLRAKIDPQQAAKEVKSGQPMGENTTYVAVVDREGNVASFINSLRNPFGSGVVVGDTGILLQNRGRDFSLDPQSVNRIEPHKRTRHTLNPVIVFKEDRPYMAIGCIGGHQQTQSLQQVLIQHIDHDLDIQEAIEAPRWSLSEEGKLHLEPALADIKDNLETKGHSVVIGQTFFGGCQAVVIDADNRVLFGGSDPRVSGVALGY